jgi:DNA-binding transcriptional LysR family regulator
MQADHLTSERLRGVATFVQVIEAGSFAAAAAKLQMSRSAVGKSISRLEQRLHIQLFQRTTRTLSVTEAGQAYYERCRRALSEIEAAEAAIDQGRHGPRGRLRVSAPRAFGRHCVAPILGALAKKHDELEVEILFSDRIVDILAERFDLAVRIGSLPEQCKLAGKDVRDAAVCNVRFPVLLATARQAENGRGPAATRGHCVRLARPRAAVALARPGRESSRGPCSPHAELQRH